MTVLASILLRSPAVQQPFSIDESRWIATSRYFWITIVERDLFGPAWQPNYIVLTHPPVARYIIGFGLWLQGWQPEQLNSRYDSLQSRSFNERAGNIPDLDLLWAARNVTYVFAVLAVTLLYAIGRVVGGKIAGLAAAGLALVNPLLSTVWTRALAESIVATFMLTTLLLSLLVLPRVKSLGRLAWTPLAIGVSLALAAATKLNGGTGALGLAAFAAIQQGLALFTTRRTAGFRSWADVGMAAVIVFVVVNPLLYVNPMERIVGLYQHRLDEMEFQRTVFSDQAVPEDLGSRVARVARRVFGTWAMPDAGLPVSPDVLLVPVGLGIVGWRAVARLRAGRAERELLLLCWTATAYGIATAHLGFDSSHYYAPLVSLNVILGGLALSALTAPVWQRLPWGRRSR